MEQIYPDLYQFSDYIPPIQLSLHQYLLLTEEPVLIHTGSYSYTERLLPELKKLLGGQKLKYILVSHFESDECGGIFLLQKEYPDVITVCSQVCERQLRGFGYEGIILAKKAGDTLKESDYEIEFIDYPSEIHLWEGLLFLENNRKIFFSSDLMFRFGETHGKTMDGVWSEEVASINKERVPDPEMLEKLKKDLGKLNPEFIAVGHGYCVKMK